MELEELRGLKTGKRTNGSSTSIKLGKLAPTISTGTEMSSHSRHLDRDQLAIEIRGQLFTEMLTRQEIQGKIEQGEGPYGSAHPLQPTELCNGIKIVLEGDDDPSSSSGVSAPSR